MKILCSLSVLSFIACSTGVAEDYNTILIQRNLATGVGAIVGDQLEPDGEIAALPLDEAGAQFQLQTTRLSDGEVFSVDTKYVGVARLEVMTTDPYEARNRTRIDQPWSVQAFGGGLGASESAPQALDLQWNGRQVTDPADLAGSSAPVDFSDSPVLMDTMTSTNTSTRRDVEGTNFTGVDPQTFMGEEFFSMWDTSATGGFVDVESVQVFPMVSASFSGFSEETVDGVQVLEPGSQITVDFVNAYPNSNLWITILDSDLNVVAESPLTGAPSGGGASLPLAVVSQGATPENRTLTISNLASFLSETGVYTIEARSQQLDFDPVPLAVGVDPFYFTRDMNVRARITTQ